MTDKSQKKIHIVWKRSGIAFTRRQRASIRGLGLRRLHHVVEREDTPQVRGLVAAIPHLVEIVKEAPKPLPWAAVPEYTVHPKVAALEETVIARRGAPTEEAEVAVEASATKSDVPRHKAEKPRHEKAPKAAKAPVPKGKSVKADKEPAKKKAKAAEKPAKSKTSKGKK